MKNSKIVFPILGILTFFLISMTKKNSEVKVGVTQNTLKADTILIKNKKSNKTYTVESFQFVNEDNLKFLVKEQKAAFVHYGFTPYYNEAFEKKYGIKIRNEGCIISPEIISLVTKNNQILANYLTGKFGEGWKKDLGITPFGLK